MTEINLRDVDQLEFLRTSFEILKNYYEHREGLLKKRKISETTTEQHHANKRARTEKSREEIVHESDDERSTATNATNNTNNTNNNNNNNADERSESHARNNNNNAATNGNRGSSDRLNWEFDRKAGPEDCFFFDFSSSALRQVYPSLSYDTEKEEMARQYTQIDQVIGELNVLIKNIATARALWNTNKKEFLRTLKINPDFKNLLSNAPEDLKKAIFAEFEAEFSMFFVREGVPVPRPFLTDNMIQKLQRLQGKYVPGLINGDLLHVPFSNLESEVLQLSPVNKTTIDQVCLKLPGRTGKDILRYLDQRGNGELGGKPIIYEDKTKYLRKSVAHESTGKIVRRREYGSLVSPANHKRIALKSVLKQFELIGSSHMPSDAIIDCKIDPSGTKVLVGTAHTNTNSITHLSLLYDLTQGSVKIFNDHQQTVSASMFSLDGSKIITASYDKDIIVRSTSTGVVEKYLGKFDGEIFEGHENKILNVIPHYEDPNMIASFSKDTVFVWDIDIGRSKAKLPKLNVSMVVDIAFGRGRYKENLFVGTETGNGRGELQIWDLERVDKPVQVINESRGMVSSIGTSSCEESSSLIVYATQDQLRLYDLRKRAQVATLKTLQNDVNIVSFSPCERYVQSSATDNRCLVFDVRFPAHPVHIFHHEPPPGIEENAEVVGVNSTKWTHFGTFLVTGGEDSMVRIWDIASGTPLISTLPGGNSHISSLDLSRSDDVIACGDESGRIHLFSKKDSCYSLSDMKPIRMRAHGAPEDEDENNERDNNFNNTSVQSDSQPSVLAEDLMRRNVESYLQQHHTGNNNNRFNNNNNDESLWSNNLVNNTNRM